MFLPNDRPIGWALAHYGEWSYDEVRLWQQIVKDGDVVVDAGANIGLFSLDFASLVGPRGRVYAFEPQPFTYQMLAGNLALNAALNVNAYHAALGRTEGSIGVPDLDFTTENCFACLALDPEEKTTRNQVPVMTIDQLHLSEVRLIKVDVEGMELEVLQGADHTIRTLRPVLYVENNRDAKSPSVVRLLAELDYSCYWHFAACYDPKNNYFGNREEPTTLPISVNMLCVPASSNLTVQGLDLVEVPQVGNDADWLQRHRFF